MADEDVRDFTRWLTQTTHMLVRQVCYCQGDDRKEEADPTRHDDIIAVGRSQCGVPFVFMNINNWLRSAAFSSESLIHLSST